MKALAFLATFVLGASVCRAEVPPLVAGKEVSVRMTVRRDFFPDAARRNGVLRGSSDLLCTVTQDEQVDDCAVTEESPSGYAFGEAALGMVKFVRVAPKAKDGAETIGRKILFKIIWSGQRN